MAVNSVISNPGIRDLGLELPLLMKLNGRDTIMLALRQGADVLSGIIVEGVSGGSPVGMYRSDLERFWEVFDGEVVLSGKHGLLQSYKTGLVVLFCEDGVDGRFFGVVVHAPATSMWYVGKYSSGWETLVFEKFNREVVLSNKKPVIKPLHWNIPL